MQKNKRIGGNDICFNISGDARGYYAWLPAIFIYHDLNFDFFDSVELTSSPCGPVHSGISIQDYRYYFEGKACNKYYPGTSFLMLPFFIIAHLSTILFTNYNADGYSLLYFKIMPLAGIFYCFIGLLFFLKILDKLKIKAHTKAFVILVLAFGTNLIFYAIDMPLYSHVYSFSLISAFLYYALCLKEKYDTRYIAALSFLIGWIFITRPVNVCILFMLPFILNGHLLQIWNEMILKPKRFLALFCGLIFPLLLFALYKISTGHFIIYSYKNEGFNFLHPHVLQYLFSYQNGVVPYTPVLVLSLILIYTWYRYEFMNLAIGIIITLIVIIYINGSWWCWWYGYAFGSRTILDFLPLFGILIALSLKHIKGKQYFYIIPAYLLCCGITILLYRQKSAGGYMSNYPIIDYWAAMRNGIDIK